MSGGNKHNKVFEQLGICPGSANAKIKNETLFWLVRLCGKDTCFRCGKKIERASELAIDHKQPWLDVSPDLFWDVESNVAFSHRICNSLHSRRNRNVYAPVGQAWCSG